MSEVHASETVIKVRLAGVGTPEDISVVTNTSEIQRKGNTQNLQMYGGRAELHKGTTHSATYTMGGRYNSGATANPRLIFEGKETQDFEITRQLEGTGSSLPQQIFTAVLTGYNDPAPVADHHMWTATFQISGEIDYDPQPA